MAAHNSLLELENKDLKRKLEEQKHLLDSNERKRKKQDLLLRQMKEKVECPVCMEIPRSGPVPVCPNGHFVCQNCRADFCHTCRTNMGNGKSLLASTLLENIDHRCKFMGCDVALALNEIQDHETICPNREVTCPHPRCSKSVALSELVNHIKQTTNGTKACGVGVLLHLDTVGWNRRNYIKSKTGNEYWQLRMYEGFGQVFCCVSFIKDNCFFFVLVMFAAEAECSRFKVDVIVHEREEEVENSKVNIRFQDIPLSIDVKDQKKICVFGVMEEMLSKIMKNPIDDCKFSVSFKIIDKRE